MQSKQFTYYCRVFGCQMNVADIDDLRARLAAHGGIQVERPELADLVLVNTCTVRQKAEEKAKSFLGGLKQVAAAEHQPFIAGMGCVVPAGRDELKQRFPHIDLLIDYSDPDIVFSELCHAFPPLHGAEVHEGYTPLAEQWRSQLRFVTAIRGCNHGCSYCVVPFARGAQRDMPLSRIVAEAQAYEAAGAPDIAVLGQNVLAYGKSSGDGAPHFAAMMQALLQQTGFRWITFLTSLACDLSDEICETIVAHPRITPLLHLPVQSGSDKVLADMRRGHDVATYKRVVEKARACRPDLYLTTDLLVGFPTETDEDFAATLRLVEEIGFDDAFMFAYSARPNTPAARELPDCLPRQQKVERLSRLIAQQRSLSADRHQRYVGRSLPVIIEQRHDDGSAVARTAFNKPVQLATCSTRPGAYARVRITSAKVSSFGGCEEPR